jgi:hypothetical protein
MIVAFPPCIADCDAIFAANPASPRFLNVVNGVTREGV